MNTKHDCCVVHRAETPPTLDDHDHRWSFKSGMQNISLTVSPSHFTGINLSPICQFMECFSDDILSFEVYAALVVFCGGYVCLQYLEPQGMLRSK